MTTPGILWHGTCDLMSPPSVSVNVVEKAIDNAHAEAQVHLVNGHRPMLLSDNGPGFTSKVLAGYLSAHGIKHIFGRPYHPQTQGKIERFHKSIKGKVCLMVYCSPEALRKAIDEAITTYAAAPHTALSNVSPRDVYAGRKEEILQKKAQKKKCNNKVIMSYFSKVEMSY